MRTALQAYFAVLQTTSLSEYGGAWSPVTPRPFCRWLQNRTARIAPRAGFLDEQDDLEEVLERLNLPSGEVRIKTRLVFSLRRPPAEERFTGSAFHTWLLRRDDAGRLRVAAQIVDGFADLNDNPQRRQGPQPLIASILRISANSIDVSEKWPWRRAHEAH